MTTLIWGEGTDQNSLENLRTCLWRLRKTLGDTEHQLIASEGEDIVLNVAAFEVDAVTFENLAARSSRIELETAASLYRGSFLEGLELDSEEFETWRRVEASRYLDKGLVVLTRLMVLLMESAETERAIEVGARILSLEPLHEVSIRHMMQLYSQSGRREAAIQLYHSLAKTLRSDLNAQPESKTRMEFERIARDGEGSQSASVEVTETKPRRRAKTRPAEIAAMPVSATNPRFKIQAAAALVVAAFIVFALGIYWQLARPRVAIAVQPQQPGLVDRAPKTHRAAAITIAVLPFANLSGEPSQQFFSDGMTEEISTGLAKIPGVQLIARTSAFGFRRDKDARSTGQALGARYVIQGTVRKALNRVRITAQLIQTDNGANVWSDSYERELTDVFVIQQDIAIAIAEALRITLGQGAGERLVSSRNVSPESHEQFLRARPLVRARFTGVPQAIAILEPLVARDPAYAPAWALLASCYAMLPTFGSPYFEVNKRRQSLDIFWPKAELAARRAIQLDPNLADAYFSLARLQSLRGRLVAADALISKAIALDPNHSDALALRMVILSNVGLKKRALETAQVLLALEPYVPTWNEDAAEVLWENEQYDAAIKIMKNLIERPTGPTSLAMMYSSLGRYADAADVLETASKDGRSKMPGWETEWHTAAALLRTAPAKAVFPQNPLRLQRAGFVYLYVGAPDHALDYYEDTIKSGLTGGQGDLFGYLWHASYAPVRKTKRFKAFLRDAGIVEYWRQRAWPDLCRPKGSDDFECN